MFYKGESQKVAAIKVYKKRCFEKFIENKSIWLNALDFIVQLDCLISIAAYGQKIKEYCFPEIVEATGVAVFPDSKLLKQNGFIANDIEIIGPVVLLTGPICSGKTTFLKQICLLLIMSQIGMPIPAKSEKISIFNYIFCKLNSKDDITNNKGTLKFELLELEYAIKNANEESLLSID